MKTVYFDNAATAHPKSDAVLKAMERAFWECGNGGRGGHPLSLTAVHTLYRCREALARLFGCESENVVLCSGATLALNMAIKGLASAGGGVVCSTLEHNAVLRPIYALAVEGRIRQGFFSPSFETGEKTVSAFKTAIAKGVRLAVFTHASNVCGMCLPVKALCEAARERGVLTVVDCAQTAGHIPVNITELGADVICVAGHKGLGGPMGTGAMIINPEFRGILNTVIEAARALQAGTVLCPRCIPKGWRRELPT